MKNSQKIADIAANSSTYFVADIAANHDGSLDKAKALIRLAAEAGADAAKFQHFKAETIVSPKGFDALGGKLTHQSSWKESVYDVYKKAELPIEWTSDLKNECEKNNIEFFTAAYDLELISKVADLVPVFKIGSGDITWTAAIAKMCTYGKPILLATGASTLEDVKRAVKIIEEHGNKYVLMQCNTNYTASEDNMRFLNLGVLNTFRSEFPKAILGLSDHTAGSLSTLAAVALGARVIEKHFTDENDLDGPDHKFSTSPQMWKEMVESVRVLESSLGDGLKVIETNEKDSAIVQRRALRYSRDLIAGEVLNSTDLIPLRPCPSGGIEPYRANEIVGLVLKENVSKDEQVTWTDFCD